MLPPKVLAREEVGDDGDDYDGNGDDHGVDDKSLPS